MVILVVFIVFVVGVVVLIEIRERRRNKGADEAVSVGKTVVDTPASSTVSPDPNCCGAHLVCERDLLDNPITEIVYYDDEELDAMKDIDSGSYTQEQVQQFAEVFYTLREEDVSGWLRSLKARNINLPDQLKDEALLIVRERR